MGTRTTTGPGGSAGETEAALLARLGLPRDASAQEVEAAHDELTGFLESAPAALRGWAADQIDRIDEAYALLSDPTIDRSSWAAAADPGPIAAKTPASTPKPTATAATPPAEWSTASAEPRGGLLYDRRIRRLALGVAALVGVVVIAVVGYNLDGGPRTASSPEPGVAASPAVDMARVGELMRRIDADPNDVQSLQALADLYFEVNEFDIAGGFLEKILVIDPQDITARLALGAALFNTGRADEAEAHWRQVLAIDPGNLEAHYDLGWVYLSRDPADVAKAKVEWEQVIAIAPDSDIARSIEQHLSSLEASPAPGDAASPGASPAATPAASPSPSGG